MAGGEKRRGLSKSCALLIVIAGIERYAFKGVASNLVTYLTDVVKMSNSRAATTVNTWSGFTFMLPLFSAPFADSYWDRFFTILASSSLYFLGLVGLTFTAFAGSRSTTKTISLYFLYTSLSLVALGLGVLNPSLQAFGADQLDYDLDHDNDHEPSSENKEVKSNRKTQFFQWWYFGVCAGSLLGVTVMAYIQDTFGWVIGFAIPTASMLLLIFLFLCGCGVYVYADPDLKAKPFQRILEIIKERVCGRNKITLVNDHDLNAMELELQDQKPLCNCSNTEANTTTKSLPDDHKSCKTGFSGLETVKLLLRLLPIWTMLLIVFGVGSFVSAALISIIETYTSSRGGKHNWFADDMSEARLDNYYWLLAFTSAISFLMYIVICKHFKSRSDDDDQCDTNC
ncbi:unnamed protein product [Arabidopsis thaliana]|uniref:(thale cress) hypothetical protein n=1 Tax=Arabidopsis thaliana TaxID=3702 RepID=A0A7G2FDR5_ARATH|nr:unnamed protein product [Arabidopsis thaliana]